MSSITNDYFSTSFDKLSDIDKKHGSP